MTVLRGFIITTTSGVFFGGLGALVGYALGRFAPDYYRIAFKIPPEFPYDPAQAGLGLGLTEGAVIGLIVGLVIVVAVAWYNSRIAICNATTQKSEETD